MINKRPRILVVDDDASLREALVSTLDEAGYEVSEADGVDSAQQSLAAVKPATK